MPQWNSLLAALLALVAGATFALLCAAAAQGISRTRRHLGAIALLVVVAMVYAQKPDGNGDDDEEPTALTGIALSSEAPDEGETDSLARWSYIDIVGSNIMYGVIAPQGSLAFDVFSVYGSTSLVDSAWTNLVRERVWPGRELYEYTNEVPDRAKSYFLALESAEESADETDYARAVIPTNGWWETPRSLASGTQLLSAETPASNSGTPANYDGVACRVHTGNTYVAPTAGVYAVTCVADDSVTVTIGGHRVSSDWQRNHAYEYVTNYVHLEAGTYPVDIDYVNLGGPGNFGYDIFPVSTNEVDVTDIVPEPPPPEGRPPKEKKVEFIPAAGCCRCGGGGCTEGTYVTNGCVRFAQKFGRTPFIPAMPAGRIVVEEYAPTNRLFTVAALKYDHPMMRRIAWCDGYDAVIEDGTGRLFEYLDGRPANLSAGLGTWLYHDGTNYIERLSEQLEVVYSGSRVSHLRGEYGGRIAVSDLGITVTRNSDGAITNIASVADGVISATPVADGESWSIAWHSPTGALFKTFTFSKIATNVCRLVEARTGGRSFAYEWTYDAGAGDWTLARDADGSSPVTESRESRYDGGLDRYIVESASGGAVTRETIDYSRGAAMVTERIVDGATVYSAIRGDDGFIASETDERGRTVAYARDAFGRVTVRTEPYAGGLAMETRCRYAPGIYRGLDTRPLEKIVRIGGVTVAHELYRYSGNRFWKSRLADGRERESFTEYDGLGRETLEVGEDLRARRYTYDDVNHVRAIEEGVFADDGFELVDGKSTAIETCYDLLGDATNETSLAFVDGEWRTLEWTEREYDISHRVTATRRSDGLTGAAEWMCSGAVWSLDGDGIAVSNRYDGAKRLVRSTRYGPLGARVTDYAYDAEGRVTNETVSAEGARDAIEDQGGANLYLFCGNNPIALYDALGHSWLSCFGDCLEEWRFDWNKIITSLSITAAFDAPVPKVASEKLWIDNGVSENTTELSRLISKGEHLARRLPLGSAARSNIMRSLGELRRLMRSPVAVGAGAVGAALTIFEGFYDAGAMLYCCGYCNGE